MDVLLQILAWIIAISFACVMIKIEIIKHNNWMAIKKMSEEMDTQQREFVGKIFDHT